MTINRDAMYQWIGLYIERLPWWRKLAAHFFERFRVTEKEYIDWIISKNSPKP